MRWREKEDTHKPGTALASDLYESRSKCRQRRGHQGRRTAPPRPTHPYHHDLGHRYQPTSDQIYPSASRLRDNKTRVKTDLKKKKHTSINHKISIRQGRNLKINSITHSRNTPVLYFLQRNLLNYKLSWQQVQSMTTNPPYSSVVFSLNRGCLDPDF